MKTRRQFIAAAAAAAAALNNACRALSDQRTGPHAGLPPALQRAANYLWSQQSSDGGWHSQTYGLLASGQSLTPFVLKALLECQPAISQPETSAVERAFEFIARHTDDAGAVGRLDPVAIDYPNYATALAIQAYYLAQPTGWQATVARMAAYLRSQQLADELGWSPSDPAYSAWGVGGEQRPAPHAGHIDLSMTRHVIEGMRAAGVEPTDPALQRARTFVERCQNFSRKPSENLDGGFYFSTVILDANKAGDESGHFRSYSTATADGLLCLQALNYPAGHERIEAARRWLANNWNPNQATGFEANGDPRWPLGLRFYNAAAGAAALAHQRTSDLAESLLPEQQDNGAWSNPENLVKEDDPLIATGFAISALGTAASQRRTTPPRQQTEPRA